VSEVIPSWKAPPSRKGKAMGTRAKAVSVGPMTVIVAASSKLPGTRGWRHKRPKGALRRNVADLRGAVGSVRTALRQLERAGMILGAVATGVELVREIRSASSNGAPSGGEAPARSSRSRSSRRTSVRSPASQSTRASRSNRTASKKTPGSRTVGTGRARPKVKKAGGTRSKANKMARSRASATKRRTSGRPRSSVRK
jgi:hypothetical protein